MLTDSPMYSRVKRLAQDAIDDCQEFLELYKGVQLNKLLVQKIDADSKILLQNLTAPLTELDDNDDPDNVVVELKKWKRVIKTFVISMLGKYAEQESAGHVPRSANSFVLDQQHNAPRNRDRRLPQFPQHPPQGSGILHVKTEE